MTAPKHSPLVERVARAICSAAGTNPDAPVYKNGCPVGTELYCKWKLYRKEAQSAIAACHAEEMRELIVALAGAAERLTHGVGSVTADNVRENLLPATKALLAKMDVQP